MYEWICRQCATDEFPDDYCVAQMHNDWTPPEKCLITGNPVEWQIRTFCYTCRRCDRRCRVNLYEDDPPANCLYDATIPPDWMKIKRDYETHG